MATDRPGGAPSAATPPALPPLTGGALALGTVALSLATFMNVLDTSIANVSIPAIAGDLGVSPDQGTWVITSFGVANAISLPLTGWLTQRYGQVRLFTGFDRAVRPRVDRLRLAPSIELLIVFRVIQGAVAGPMIPLSQSLLLSSYPKERAGTALAMWAITTLVAPVVGPLLGGWITDNISWPWIFYINVPVGIVAAVVVWMIYRDRETPTVKLPIDGVGLGLLVLWVGAMQIMLDKGKDLDWFQSGQIVTLAIVAVVGFALFVVWELTDEHPVVDLRLFARRNFWTSTVSRCRSPTECSSATSCCCRCGCSSTWATRRHGPAWCSRRWDCSRSCSRRWSGATSPRSIRACSLQRRFQSSRSCCSCARTSTPTPTSIR